MDKIYNYLSKENNKKSMLFWNILFYIFHKCNIKIINKFIKSKIKKKLWI